MIPSSTLEGTVPQSSCAAKFLCVTRPTAAVTLSDLRLYRPMNPDMIALNPIEVYLGGI